MRYVALAVLVACGGPGGPRVNVTTQLARSGAPPEDVDVHLHETPAYVADTSKLYVEVTSDGEHGEMLRKSASAGLVAVPYVVAVEDGGDVELHVELTDLKPAADGATCKVKVYALRLPQHDLLAIADGGGQVIGAGASDDCLSATGTAIVRDKLPALFKRQLEAKQ